MGRAHPDHDHDLGLDLTDCGAHRLGRRTIELGVPAPAAGAAAGAVPVPQATRFVKDGKGKLVYIGDSATISFVHTVRQIVEARFGECDFTTDGRSELMLEIAPELHVSLQQLSLDAPHLVSDLADIEDLARHYLTIATGVFKLFEDAELLDQLRSCFYSPPGDPGRQNAVVYLLLAIGAQARGQDADEDQAELYFQRGQQLASSSLTSDPSVSTVQAYILITLYMLNACRRNGAFMNLGIAVRAAYALGVHRSDASTLFDEKDRQPRERCWKCLRVLDLFTSASLGRPPATAEFGQELFWLRYPTDTVGELGSDEQTEFASVKLCYIFERIMTEVYTRPTVTLEKADSISRHFREWARALPDILNIETGAADEFDPSVLPRRLSLSYLTGAYYWSIILLTRPFLIHQVSTKMHLHSTNHDDDNDDRGDSLVEAEEEGSHSSVATFADACVDSAVRGLDVADMLLRFGTKLPKKLFLVVNSVFASALVVGVAVFGDYDTSFPLSDGLIKAEKFLAVASKSDPQAGQYLEIVRHLRAAVEGYIRRRHLQKMERRSKHIKKLFGTVPVKSFNHHQHQQSPPKSLSHSGEKVLSLSQSLSSSSNENSGECGQSSTNVSQADDMSSLDAFLSLNHHHPFSSLPTSLPSLPLYMDALAAFESPDGLDEFVMSSNEDVDLLREFTIP